MIVSSIEEKKEETHEVDFTFNINNQKKILKKNLLLEMSELTLMRLKRMNA